MVTERFDAWNVGKNAEGRPIAAAGADLGFDLRQLRLECVAGGRLEYIPIAADGQPVRSMWIDADSDTVGEMQLQNGRLSGKRASDLSQAFLRAEKEATANNAKEWAMLLVINDQGRAAAPLYSQGFAQMRAHMLANCKG
jgi:hypothetical protein